MQDGLIFRDGSAEQVCQQDGRDQAVLQLALKGHVDQLESEELVFAYLWTSLGFNAVVNARRKLCLRLAGSFNPSLHLQLRGSDINRL